jgi:CRP-like cAMP-binding protein
MEQIPELRRTLLGYLQAALAQTGQLVVCSTRHELRSRLARWLLTANDQLSSTELPITHECLSRALGVRRAGITDAAGRMEKAGLIGRGRGRISIIDRSGLEQEACPCYWLIRNEYQRVLTGLHQPAPTLG